MFSTNFTALLYETVTERLHYRNVCARWEPKMLSVEQVFIQKGIEHTIPCQKKDSENPTRIHIYKKELKN